MKLAVFLHLYYLDLWEEIAAYLENLNTADVSFTLYTSLVRGTGSPRTLQLQKSVIEERFPGAVVMTTENRGKDIGGFLTLMDYFLIESDHPPYLVKIHTKKSSHLKPRRKGIHWRKTLIEALIGNPQRIHEITELFETNRSLGMVGAGEYLYKLDRNGVEVTIAGINSFYVMRLLNKFRIQRRASAFIGGTMFWTRTNILTDFFKQFPPEEIRQDLPIGDHNDNDNPTLTHAMERIFGYLITNKEKEIWGLPPIPDDESEPHTTIDQVTRATGRGVFKDEIGDTTTREGTRHEPDKPILPGTG